MDQTKLVNDTKDKLQAATDHLNDELKKIRTGRANTGMLDGIVVEVYGTRMPLNQVASIVAPEPQLLQVTPFDPSNLAAISAVIRDNQSLGLNPMDDGHVVRLPIPPLTQERREQLVRSIGEKVEQCMISLRNIRHESIKTIEQAKKDKQLSENDQQRLEKQIDEAMSNIKSKIDGLAQSKEAEVLTV